MAILRKRAKGEPSAGGPRRRLKHRLPVRLRHYWKIPVAIIAGLAALILVFGDARVRPYFGAEPVAEDTVTDNIAGQGDLFDGGEHTIEVSYNESEYADMMRTFREEGEKEFIRADITIDGTVISDVGIRLKGNSTLASLGGAGGIPGGGGQGGPPAGGGGEGGQGAPREGGEGRAAQQGEGNAPQEEAPAGGEEQESGGGGGGPGGVELSEDEPETIPWLISFEEFSEGRAYQGHTEIALRPGIGSATALSEALALELTAADGQDTQDYTFTEFSVNGGDAVPRLLLDPPDAAWAEERGDGVLYKARAGGTFDYLGDDPTDYEDAFNQINGEGVQDLQPVMDLLRFVEEAGDEEFARGLDDYLDTESFARYLALQNLISNGDAMDGPGNNYYLWYDTEDERFTVLSWDLNLSFGAMEDKMPSGGDGGDGGGPPELPDGAAPEDDAGGEPPAGAPGDGEGGGAMGSGALKERFLDNAEFTGLYEDAYAELYSSLVASGTAADLLDQVAGRAEEAGDSGARATAEDLTGKLGSIAKEPQEDAGMPGPGGSG